MSRIQRSAPIRLIWRWTRPEEPSCWRYADFISNGRSILALDRKFGEVYLGEMRDALLLMQRKDQARRAIVEQIVEQEEGISKL